MTTNATFISLIKEQKSIRIPKIQRDYAQGRRSFTIDEIRKNFVRSLAKVIKGQNDGMELDFIYGSERDNAFEPLDGQQRLTTLFLLHWILESDCLAQNSESGIKSVLAYETRVTSQEFCDELVKHKATQIYAELAKINSNNSDNVEKNQLPSEIIRKRDWFKWVWKFDPTVLSMLVVIDSFYGELFSADINPDLSLYRSRLDNISFRLLNLGTFGLSDELFVKMNARGKQLSDFDNLKASLDEEIQLQKDQNIIYNNKKLANENTEKIWRKLFDKEWTDFFWQRCVLQRHDEEQQINEQSENHDISIKEVERQYKILVLRLIALQLAVHPENDIFRNGVNNDIHENNLDMIMPLYRDFCEKNRQTVFADKESENTLFINFDLLIKDINNIIFSKNNRYCDITSNLENAGITPPDQDRQIAKTLLEEFLHTDLDFDTIAIFYSIILYLRKFPAPKKDNSKDNSYELNEEFYESWFANFTEWCKFSRNTNLNVNSNDSVVNNKNFHSILNSINNRINELKSYLSIKNLCVNTDQFAIVRFIASLDENNKRENASIIEEVEKSKLKLSDSKWYDLINTYESHPYLWGQIRCLLNWSGNDMDKFEQYGDKLVQILNYKDNGFLFYACMLIMDCKYWQKKNSNNTLFLFNKDQQYGLKRYLRDIDGNDIAPCLKKLIDKWITEKNDLDVKDFYKGLIAGRTEANDFWANSLIQYPEMISFSRFRRIDFEDTRLILLEKKRRDSAWCDPCLYYIWKFLENKSKSAKLSYENDDGKGYRPKITFTITGKKHTITIGEQNSYSIRSAKNQEIIFNDPHKIMDHLKLLPGICSDAKNND